MLTVPNGDASCTDCHSGDSLGAEWAHSIGLRAGGTEIVSLEVTSVKFDGTALKVKVGVNLYGEKLTSATLADLKKSIPEKHHIPVGVLTGKSIVHRITPEYHQAVRLFDTADSAFTMRITESAVMEDFENLVNITVFVSSDVVVCVDKIDTGEVVLAECKDAGNSGIDYGVASGHEA